MPYWYIYIWAWLGWSVIATLVVASNSNCPLRYLPGLAVVIAGGAGICIVIMALIIERLW